MESQATVETACPERSEGDKNLLYLYCLFKGPASLASQKGIDGVNSIFVLCYQDLCALVSQVPTHAYNEQTLNRQIEDLEWLIPKANRHEEIVRYVMGVHPVIPVKFGTLYASRERVLDVLCNGYDEFDAFLDFIRDKEEWGIKVYTDEGADKTVGREGGLAPTNLLIEQLDKEIAAAPLGKAYLLQKKRENLIRQQSTGILNHLSNQLYQQMLSYAVEGRRNKLLSKQATGKAVDMLLNAAFLLNKREVETFKEKLEALAATAEYDAFSFEMSGPWPCYNFCPEFHI